MKADPARALFAAAGLIVVAGVALRLAPVRVGLGAAEPLTVERPLPEPSGRERAEALLSYQEIVEANVFSSDRSPPETRYVPPEFLAEVAPAEPPQRLAPQPRLFGVAVGPAGAVALIDADPSIPGAEVYRLGDAVGDARLVAIEDTGVVLEGPGGRTVLNLPSSSRR